ncbi:response regulator [Deinococcus budaensis]|uniref:response regulator n=1 Tax=Deinococcus budaensis TaxID=1665626 RepID=UPI0035F3F0F1
MDPDLTETFLQDAASVLGALEDATVQLWLEEGRPGALRDLAVLSHRLRGTAALYGHPQTAALAGVLERLLEGRAGFGAEVTSALVGLLETAQLCLAAALTRLRAGQSEGDVGLDFSRRGGAAQLGALLRAYPQSFRPVAPDGEAEAASSGPEASVPFAQTQPDLWAFFAPEARELIETLRGQLAEDQPDLNAMFRAAHTLKGSAAMVGLAPLGQLGHTLEDLLGRVREEALALARAAQLLGAGLVLAERLLDQAEGSSPAAGAGALDGAALDATQLDGAVLDRYAAQVQALLSGQPTGAGVGAGAGAGVGAPDEAAAPLTRLIVRLDGEQLGALQQHVARLVTGRARLGTLLTQQRTLAEQLDEAHARIQQTIRDFEERHLNPTLGAAPAAGPQAAGDGGGAPDRAPRFADFSVLELDSYSDLNVLARSLTELSADLSEIRSQGRAHLAQLGDELTGLEKVTRALRGDVSRARLTRLGRATAPLHRWVRERGGLRLHVEGEDLQLDAATVPPLAQALLHLVTNAATHGLEPQDERTALGKPALGAVTVTARAEGGQLTVTVQDDGRGLPLAALRERALAAGHLSAAELAGLSAAQTAQLAFLPGLSTARSLTREAGRGVGMDAVRSAVEALGGEVRLDTRAGAGTTVTLALPLAQQIADVLVARVGGVRVALLVSQVQGLRPLEGDTAAAAGEGDPAAPGAVADLHALWGEVPGPRRSVARLSSAGGPVDVIADEFTQLEEVVLRPAGRLLAPLGYLAGTAVGAGGQALPVLNPSGLLAAARRPAAGAALRAANPGPRAQRRILVVDDSLSVRKHLGRILTRAGFEVLAAADGREALGRLLTGADPVDAVLTDLEMPHANGFEVIEGLRGHGPTAALPIVVMTTRTGEKQQRLALALGADDYFAKPADEGLLLRRLDALLAPAASRARAARPR